MTRQQMASLARQGGGLLISALYTWALSTGKLHQVPSVVDAVIVAMGPAVVTLEHYVSDPSTGTPPAPPPAAPVYLNTPTTSTVTVAPPAVEPPVTVQAPPPVAPAPPPAAASPAAVPPQWGTMDSTPVATPGANPAPPPPGA
jgi:hypothetical protein